MYLLSWIVVGLVAGWLGGKILKGDGYGTVMDIAMGIGGAVAGGLLMQSAGLGGHWGAISTTVVAVISYQSDTVEQILFSFYNGELYKISVTYDRSSTEGLTEEDMVKSISAKYGPPTYVALAIDYAPNDRHGVTQTPVASWEDAQYSFNLVRSSFTDHLGLVIYSKRVNADAELHIAEAVKLEEQEGPQKEADRLKKQTDDLETARQKNRKMFRP